MTPPLLIDLISEQRFFISNLCTFWETRGTAIFQMFIASHISPSRGKTICALLYQYVKCLLLRIYSPVGVNNMYSNISNVHCFAYILKSGKTLCVLQNQYVKCLLFRIYSHVGVNNMYTFIQQYFKCLLFRIYPQVRENNMCTFILICQMFTISHIFSCQGK